MPKHYGKYPGGMHYYTACGLWGSIFYTLKKATRIRNKVTCKNCLRTKNYAKTARLH